MHRPAGILVVVARSAVAEGRRLEGLDPTGADAARGADHSVVHGVVGLQVVLGQADDLALDDEVADLQVIDVPDVSGRSRAGRE